MTGVSRKTKNRVVRLAELYVLEAGKFYFKAKENLLLIPSPEERGSLIVDAHLYGHCGMHSVVKRLKGKYFWKGMVKDIGRIVRSCGICQQFNRESIVTDSPSKPILVSGIFEKVGMDLVLGFPETKDGFVGCLVLTEYLSKFPMVYPVRSKNAEEIAAHLLDYVSLFGAPREIISDQGTEFINLVVDKMLTGFGIVHAHTTAYNPRTNGLTERFNQTLVSMLKKYSVDNPSEWDAWLPYALLSYRSRIHSVINKSPFEVLFGVTMNLFDESLRSTLTMNDLRPVELKNLVEGRNYSVEALKRNAQHIRKAQEVDKIVESVASGTAVYIKLPKKSKFSPVWNGPYYVVRKAANGNYVLRNSVGKELPNPVPWNKLKIGYESLSSANCGEEVYEIEKVLSHRMKDGQMLYLVKWRGFEETTWEPTEHFHNPTTISNYWTSKGGKML
jgi:hypothetical protein